MTFRLCHPFPGVSPVTKASFRCGIGLLPIRTASSVRLPDRLNSKHTCKAVRPLVEQTLMLQLAIQLSSHSGAQSLRTMYLSWDSAARFYSCEIRENHRSVELGAALACKGLLALDISTRHSIAWTTTI